MNNPYKILSVNQNADKKEIMKAQLIAMKDKNYSLQEIHSAARQLLDPAKRLAADFMYPTKVKAKRPQKITINFEVPEYNLNEIDDNSFDSLK